VIVDLYQDAALYDLLNDGYRDDLAFYRGLADDHGGPVLELGAGSGRVTVALARSGHEVLAVEPAAAMRARGIERLAAAGRSDRVRWFDADMRRLDLGITVPLAIAPFHALMHLESIADQDAALRAIRAHLTPGGVFATDVYVPSFGADGVVRSEPVWAGAGGAAADVLVWQHHDPVAQVVVTEHRLDAVDDSGRLVRRRATLRQRYYRRFELERALLAAGFRDVRTHGGFARGPVTRDDRSWAFVALA
jgi:SAM-dependent methyltransferase